MEITKQSANEFLSSLAIQELLDNLKYTRMYKNKVTENDINKDYKDTIQLKVTNLFNIDKYPNNELLLKDNSRFSYDEKNYLTFKYDKFLLSENKLPRYMQHHTLYAVRLNDKISLITDGGYILDNLINFSHTSFMPEPDDLWEYIYNFAEEFNLTFSHNGSSFIKFVHHDQIFSNEESIYKDYFDFLQKTINFINKDKYSYSNLLKRVMKD